MVNKKFDRMPSSERDETSQLSQIPHSHLIVLSDILVNQAVNHPLIGHLVFFAFSLENSTLSLLRARGTFTVSSRGTSSEGGSKKIFHPREFLMPISKVHTTLSVGQACMQRAPDETIVAHHGDG